MSSSRTIICLLRNDLRLHDNEVSFLDLLPNRRCCYMTLPSRGCGYMLFARFICFRLGFNIQEKMHSKIFKDNKDVDDVAHGYTKNVLWSDNACMHALYIVLED